jgi:hypothetical protein
MNEKLKINFHTVVILPISCLLAFSGCSSIEGTVANHRRTAFEEDGWYQPTQSPSFKIVH